MNDTSKGIPANQRRAATNGRIRKGHMPKQRKNAIAKTSQSTATKVQPVATPKDVLPKAEYIKTIGTMGVQVGQNIIFFDNTGKNSKLKLTHAGIAEVWNKAWPTRKIVTERGGFTAFHVTGALRDYNKGIHGKNANGEVAIPKAKCGKWVFSKDTGKKKYIEV
jgi:hypothetical protein